ncbi:DUF732 domain-containing protein [[Mycobacterium] nativiensis]|uniref:DUF732 domain-containing protein n=1 Tax=[Mycobacterium] nativiensis TaxID=2855503 RepID=A0ABU5XW94_9MYCO|nr:DUF732 domain-containing protein [Mycolicibacter sp. MYC340]MEB3032208.1 DUF732 domain-containing protein [Mycolicibacter sp. MYC340]
MAEPRWLPAQLFFGTLAGAVCATAVVVAAAPAHADPTDSSVLSVDTAETALVRALDQVGIRHPDDRQAVDTAHNVCQRIRDGFSADETVEELQKANPGLGPSRADAFVKVARTVYCPSVGVGQMPGYPGRA